MGSGEQDSVNSFQFDGINWRLHAGVILVYRVVAHVSLLGRNLPRFAANLSGTSSQSYLPVMVKSFIGKSLISSAKK